MRCLVFDDMFCTSKKGGIGGGGRISAWGAEHMTVALAVEWPWLALTGPFLYLLAQTGIENIPLPL